MKKNKFGFPDIMFEKIKKFAKNYLEKNNYKKSDIKSEGYWYTSKDGSESVNLLPLIEKVLTAYEEYSEEQLVQFFTPDKAAEIIKLMHRKKENWDEICEIFNVEVADKSNTFVTATEFFNFMKINSKFYLKN